MEGEGGIVTYAADLIGVPDNVLRVISSLLFGYPLAWFHRVALYNGSPGLQNLYFTITGIAICYFNFGFDSLHSIANILLIYAVLVICGGTVTSIVLAFLINMTYLCVGYYYTMSETYTIKWTTPQCVLTLRLIGLVYDVYDGRREFEKLSVEEKETALSTTPSLLEIFAHSYHFGGFLVGPQFPMKRYQNFVEGKLITGSTVSSNGPNGKPHSVKPAILRLASGLLYIAVYQLGSLFYPDTCLMDDSFMEMNLFVKCFTVAVWGKLTLYKYVGCWLMAEGSCILLGMTFNGRDENGNELWNGCANIHARDFERASTCHQLVESFNVNTNKWMAKYVFKRLKFLGNKNISKGVTLFYLALWHGLYSGYYMNFFLEFLILKFEKEIDIDHVGSRDPILMPLEVTPMLSTFPPVTLVKSLPGGVVVTWCIKKFYTQFVLGYALVSFCLLSFSKYWAVYTSLYLFGHIFFIAVWPVTNFLVTKFVRKRRTE